MRSQDYSLHYLRFHDDSEEHAKQMAAGFIDILAPHLPPNLNAPIVDIGCGFGFQLRALRELGYTNIQGVEISPQQAEHCRRSGLTVHLVEDSSEWLSRHPSTFAFALLFDLIEHVPNNSQIDFLHAVYTSLKPNGRLILTTPNANSPIAARWRYIDHTHHTSFTEHSLNYILANAGFTNIQIDSGKPLGRMPRRLWRQSARNAWRKWFIRWCWLQVYKAELPWEDHKSTSFELNLRALASKQP